MEDAAKFPKLALLEGHAKEKEIDLTIHKYVQLATAETAKSEYEEVYWEGEKIEEVFSGSHSYTENWSGMEITYLDNAFAQFIALKQGFANLMVYDETGEVKLNSNIVPILNRERDGTIFTMIGLVDQNNFANILDVLTVEQRTRLYPILAATPAETKIESIMANGDLQSFVSLNNQELLSKNIIEPKMDNFPDAELSSMGYWIFEKVEN